MGSFSNDSRLRVELLALHARHVLSKNWKRYLLLWKKSVGSRERSYREN